eukprot:6191008-Pleurochrysis_carterae.AAC.1
MRNPRDHPPAAKNGESTSSRDMEERTRSYQRRGIGNCNAKSKKDETGEGISARKNFRSVKRAIKARKCRHIFEAPQGGVVERGWVKVRVASAETLPRPALPHQRLKERIPDSSNLASTSSTKRRTRPGQGTHRMSQTTCALWACVHGRTAGTRRRPRASRAGQSRFPMSCGSEAAHGPSSIF